MAKIKGLRYLGGGFIAGVPSRDLTEEEVSLYDVDRLIVSGLYEPITPKPVKAEETEPQDDKEPADELEEV